MNTCHDCIHEDVCSALIEKGLPWADGEYPAEAFCMAFRYKAEWISVEERLPETEGWYLVYTAPDKKHRSINKAEFCKGFEWNNFEPYWRGAGGNWGNVTHWMPLPEPPQMEGGAE